MSNDEGALTKNYLFIKQHSNDKHKSQLLIPTTDNA